jgi:hypothetical protein
MRYRLGILGLAVIALASITGAGSRSAPNLVAMSVAAFAPAKQGDVQTEQRDDRGGAGTIAGLQHLSVVGSTQFIVDGAGHTQSVDANPYGVTVVPAGVGAGPGLEAGDLLVTNIGGQDQGTTVARFPASEGPGHVFNIQADSATLGPANAVVDAGRRTVWVANATGNNLQVFSAGGAVLATIRDAHLNHPWGLATNLGGQRAPATPAVFTSNVVDATIERVVPQAGRTGTTYKVTPIGRLGMAGAKTKIGLAWVPRATIKGRALADVLFAVDPATNGVVAYPNASKAGPAAGGITVFRGKPVNLPNEVAVNPLNGDLIITDLNDNNLVEINPADGRVVATRLADNAPVDLQTGNGSALIGLAATTDGHGNLIVYFADDNMNSLNVLSV